MNPLVTYEVRTAGGGVATVVACDGFVPKDGDLEFRLNGKTIAEFKRGSWDQVWALMIKSVGE